MFLMCREVLTLSLYPISLLLFLSQIQVRAIYQQSVVTVASLAYPQKPAAGIIPMCHTQTSCTGQCFNWYKHMPHMILRLVLTLLMCMMCMLNLMQVHTCAQLLYNMDTVMLLF